MFSVTDWIRVVLLSEVSGTLVDLKKVIVLASYNVYCTRCHSVTRSYFCQMRSSCFLFSICISWSWIFFTCRACRGLTLVVSGPCTLVRSANIRAGTLMVSTRGGEEGSYALLCVAGVFSRASNHTLSMF